MNFEKYRSPLRATVTDCRFTTRDAMYLANELDIGSTDFVKAAGAIGLPLDKEFLYTELGKADNDSAHRGGVRTVGQRRNRDIGHGMARVARIQDALRPAS